jgi:tetratricopeptide (TPR) repeat protein
LKKVEGNEKKVKAISKQATVANANLNLGYASMELEDYKQAQNYFSKTSQPENESEPEIKVNATIRQADAAFMQKGFKEAARLYEKVVDANVPESDYARIQKAIIFGLQGKPSEKIKLLQTVVDNTNSQYNFEARFELANTYMEDDKFQHAINLLAPIAEQKDSRSNFPVKALMKTGFAYEQLKNDSKATETYKSVIAEYPKSKEKYEALNALKSIFIEHNHPESYTNLLAEFNLPEAGSAAIDSTYYAAAEAQIANENWFAAKAALNLYLKKYPNGIFAIKANYYKGESHFQLKEFEESLNAFDDVLQMPWNDFTEASAKRAADISFNNKKHEQAMKYFVVLRSNAMSKEMLQQAYLGMTYTSFYLNEMKTALAYADTVLSIPELPNNTSNEVLFLKAKIYQQQGKSSDAIELYSKLKDFEGTSIAPEVHYRMAELYLKQNKLKDAENEAAKATELNIENNYFVDKSWLLIVDILLKEKDYFNAKATLQSIVKNTKNADLKKEAKQKLEEVKRLEKQQSKLRDE